MKGAFAKIIIFILPFLCVLLLFNRQHQIPTFQQIMQKFAEMPDLKTLIINDFNEVITTFKNIPYSFNFQIWSFPSFDASSMGAFFGSIGAFFSAFGSNLANTFTSLFGGLGAFFNAIGSLLKCVGSTLINVLTYLLYWIYLLFDFS